MRRRRQSILPPSIQTAKFVSSELLAKPLTKLLRRPMIKVTTVDGQTLVVNEDYIITIYDLSGNDAEENATLLMDVPKKRKNVLAVTDTMDELYYEINRV
jgi:hypothetical protein